MDVNPEMIAWCKANLQRDGFSFHHHDVWSPTYAPKNSKRRILPIEPLGSGFTMIEANSVFTHLHADQTEFYLEQMRKMLAPMGLIRATWFLFNKKCFPMMNERQNTLFVDESDLTSAVYYDWHYLVDLIRSMGFRMVKIDWTPFLGVSQLSSTWRQARSLRTFPAIFRQGRRFSDSSKRPGRSDSGPISTEGRHA